MDRCEELEIAEQLLVMMEQRTTSLTDSVYEIPVETYTDEDRLALERIRLFRQLPLWAALSGEVRNPGDWKTFDGPGVPVLIVRGADGQVRAFLNVCRHRGARLVDGRGSSPRLRLTCPYHAWTYDAEGALAGLPMAQGFPELCREERGLVPLPCVERHGVVWVVANPAAAPLDIDRHLGDLGPELARWNLDQWYYVESGVHTVRADWKLNLDTFIESYHVPYLHRDSVGALLDGHISLHTPLGEHHRFTQVSKDLIDLRQLPREEWNPWADKLFGLVYVVFPNTVFFLLGDHAESFQVFPGESPGTSIMLHTQFSLHEDAEDVFPTFELIFDIIEEEDYPVAAGVERNLRSMANQTLVFGRNEGVLHHMHDDFRRHLGLSPLARPADAILRG